MSLPSCRTSRQYSTWNSIHSIPPQLTRRSKACLEDSVPARKRAPRGIPAKSGILNAAAPWVCFRACRVESESVHQYGCSEPYSCRVGRRYPTRRICRRLPPCPFPFPCRTTGSQRPHHGQRAQEEARVPDEGRGPCLRPTSSCRVPHLRARADSSVHPARRSRFDRHKQAARTGCSSGSRTQVRDPGECPAFPSSRP